ncbi:MAG: hypothetical protein AAGA62_13585, partial [Bacteroidota bacterium]
GPDQACLYLGIMKNRHLLHYSLTAILLSAIPLYGQSIYSPIVVSTDAGESWQARAEGLPPTAKVSALVEADATLWAATDANGVYQLPEEAARWKPTSNGLPKHLDINSLAVKGNSAVVGTYRQGIYYSTDNGLHWRRPVFNVPAISVRALLFLSDSEILAGTDDGLYRSADGGANWFVWTKSPQINDLLLRDGTLYLGRADGLFRSTDKGKTTTELLAVTTGDILADDNYLYSLPTGGDIFRAPHGTTNWTTPNTSISHSQQEGLPATLWQGLHHAHVSCGTFKAAPGVPEDVGFRIILDTPDRWVAACLQRR